MQDDDRGTRRRNFLKEASAWGSLALVAGCSGGTPRPKGPEHRKEQTEIGASEDLMREHGVLRRVLLVYDEAERRLRAGAEVPSDVIGPASRLIRSFVQDYHERLEERFVFPLFEEEPVFAQLTQVLVRQHQAGRLVIDRILSLSKPGTFSDMAARRELADQLHSFCRMYRPHAAREDTVLFPALHQILVPSAYRALGERFEAEEHALFDGNGFAQAVAEITHIERSLGIESLSQFTPT